MTFLDYARRGKNSLWRYLLACGLVAIVVVAAAVFAGLLLGMAVSQGVAPSSIVDVLQDTSHPHVFFTVIGLTFAIMLVGVATGVVVAHGKEMTDVLGAWRWSGFVIGFVLWGLVVAGITWIDWLAVPGAFTRSAVAFDPKLVAIVVVSLAVQTFAEEYVFRGYLTQGLLLATRNEWATACISGLLFGLCHIPNGMTQALFATAFGVVLSLIAMRSGGLALGYGMHFVNNLFAALVVVSADDIFRGTPGLFSQAGHTGQWWDAILAAGALMAFLHLFGRARAVKTAKAASA